MGTEGSGQGEEKYQSILVSLGLLLKCLAWRMLESTRAALTAEGKATQSKTKQAQTDNRNKCSEKNRSSTDQPSDIACILVLWKYSSTGSADQGNHEQIQSKRDMKEHIQRKATEHCQSLLMKSCSDYLAVLLIICTEPQVYAVLHKRHFQKSEWCM